MSLVLDHRESLAQESKNGVFKILESKFVFILESMYICGK